MIIFILNNKLEDRELQLTDFLLDENQAATKFKVGKATIAAWYKIGMLKGIKIGDSIYFAKNVKVKNKLEETNE